MKMRSFVAIATINLNSNATRARGRSVQHLFDAGRIRFVLKPLACLAIIMSIGGLTGCPANNSGGQVSGPASQQNPSNSTGPKPEDLPGSADSSTKSAEEREPTPQSLNRDLTVIFDLIRKRQTGPARVRLVNYLKLHPDDPQATFLFGLTYHREQKYSQAVPHFKKALELGPDYQLSNYFLGWAQFYLGELEEARTAFETFLRSKPDEPDSIFGLGLIAMEEDRLEDAEQLFKRSIELQLVQPTLDVPGLSKAQARLGETFARQNRLHDARAVLETSTKLNPDGYEAFYQLYRVLVRLGEQEQADIVHKQYLESRNRVRPGTAFPE